MSLSWLTWVYRTKLLTHMFLCSGHLQHGLILTARTIPSFPIWSRVQRARLMLHPHLRSEFMFFHLMQLWQGFLLSSLPWSPLMNNVFGLLLTCCWYGRPGPLPLNLACSWTLGSPCLTCTYFLFSTKENPWMWFLSLNLLIFVFTPCLKFFFNVLLSSICLHKPLPNLLGLLNVPLSFILSLLPKRASCTTAVVL